jgi:hypothetical protein
MVPSAAAAKAWSVAAACRSDAAASLACNASNVASV